MANDTIQVDYEQLRDVSRRFAQQAEACEALQRTVQQRVDALTNGGWTGEGAQAFAQEMETEVFPALQRLVSVFHHSSEVTGQIAQTFRQAEHDAMTAHQTNDGVSYPATQRWGGATFTGTPTAAGAAKVGKEGLTAEQELIRDLFGAADTAHKGADVLAKLLPAGKRVTNISEHLGFKATGAAISGLVAGMDAAERGVSSTAAIADGTVAGVLGLTSSHTGLGGPIESIVGVVHGITSAISPEAGQYTGIVADAMPGQVAEKIAVGTIDTADALIRGDYDQLVKHHEQNLAGSYGEVIRGYAIGADALGAFVTGDNRALDQLSDAAASGKLGKLAEFGDWLGGEIFDWLH